MKPGRKKSGASKPTARKATPRTPIRVAVLESDPLRFIGFRALFGSGSEFSVRACTVPMILKALDDDVILMTRNRGAAFYSAMSSMKAVRPGVRIIVTGPGCDEEDILRAIASGAKGYISEDADPAAFKKAIRLVHRGSVWAPRTVLRPLLNAPQHPPRLAS